MMFYPQDLPKVKLLVFHLHLFKTLTSPPLDIENFCVYTVVYKWNYVLDIYFTYIRTLTWRVCD